MMTDHSCFLSIMSALSQPFDHVYLKKGDIDWVSEPHDSNPPDLLPLLSSMPLPNILPFMVGTIECLMRRTDHITTCSAWVHSEVKFHRSNNWSCCDISNPPVMTTYYPRLQACHRRLHFTEYQNSLNEAWQNLLIASWYCRFLDTLQVSCHGQEQEETNGRYRNAQRSDDFKENVLASMWTAFGLDSKQRDKKSITTSVSRKKVNLIPLRLRPALFVSSDYAELMLFLILTIDYVLCSELPKEVNRYWRTKKKIILWVLHSYTQTNSIQTNTKVPYHDHATCTALRVCSFCSALSSIHCGT